MNKLRVGSWVRYKIEKAKNSSNDPFSIPDNTSGEKEVYAVVIQIDDNNCTITYTCQDELYNVPVFKTVLTSIDSVEMVCPSSIQNKMADVEKSMEESNSAIDSELHKNRTRISQVEQAVDWIADKLKVYDFLKEHPFGHCFDITYSYSGKVTLHVYVAGAEKVHHITHECGIRVMGYSRWRTAAIEDIPITNNKRVIHVAIMYENSYYEKDFFHSFFIFDKEKDKDEMLTEVDNPISYVNENLDTLSRIGLPIPKRYIKKMNNIGLTLKLPRKVKRYTTIKEHF